ncbi:MAG: glycosyltransferase family 2 protein [Propionibacteriaceae bacterium]|nr:glycosyltransferase family 2 protein [Propionibacteriaceae bacterium]
MPLLSIVVASHNTENYLGEALKSLIRQQWSHIEIIIVDDGSTDRTADVAAQFTGSTIRLIRQSHRGPGAARNVGASLAKGKYLAFFDSDDIADPFFYRQAIFGLEKTHSDFAVGSYGTLIDSKLCLPPPYIQVLHRSSRRGVVLSQVPEVMTNALMCTRVYRRDFYERAVAPQPEGVFFEDQLLTMRAFVRARGFDILHQPALQWRRRETKDTTTQQAGEAHNLRERVRAYKETADFLLNEGRPEIRVARLAQILATDQLTLTRLSTASEEYFDIARQFLEWAIAEVGQETYAEQVDVQDRVLQAVVMRMNLEAAQSFLEADGRNLKPWVFRSDSQGLLAWLPGWQLDQSADVPLSTRRVGRRQAEQIPPEAILAGGAH